MIKLAGALLIIIAMYFVGNYMVEVQKNTYKTLLLLQNMAIDIKELISHYNLKLTEIFIKITNSNDDIVSLFLNQVINGLKLHEGTLEYYWNNATKSTFINLFEEDIANLSNLGKYLGQTSIDTQITYIDLYITKNQQRIDDTYEKLKKNERIYKICSTFAGVIITIILI